MGLFIFVAFVVAFYLFVCFSGTSNTSNGGHKLRDDNGFIGSGIDFGIDFGADSDSDNSLKELEEFLTREGVCNSYGKNEMETGFQFDSDFMTDNEINLDNVGFDDFSTMNDSIISDDTFSHSDDTFSH
jgi:hypothetical protein